MSDLSNNIKQYRKSAKLTQAELANLLKVAPTAISAWENGRNKPLMDNIEQMSEIFHIKKSELLGETFEDLKKYDFKPVPTIELPYLGTVSAGGFEYAAEYNETMNIPSHLINDDYHKYFILKANGDSMNREIANGHHVIVQDIRDGSYQIKNGDVVIFKNHGEYTMKRVKKTDTMIYLEPDSYLDGFSTQSFIIGEDHDLEIVGKVVYSFKEY